jgi:hypothetical protein
MPDDNLAAAAPPAPALRQVVALTRWVGPGRKLTQTGQLTMADARHLVGLLETGDAIDPVIGTRMFRTRSSADLPRLAIVVTWAKAVGLLRVVHGRLVPVKKNQRLLDRPGQQVVGPRYQNAKSVLTVAGDPLPVQMASSRASRHR